MHPTPEKDKVERPDFFARLYKRMTNVVAVEKEADILLDHDYDGIQELDNSLPPWWKWGFYISIIWAIGYISYYHVFDMGDLSHEELRKEMVEAQKQIDEYNASVANNVNESNVTLLTDESSINAGKGVFTKNCVSCHLEGGMGSTGPNLTDDYWVHGGDVKDVFSTIKYGVIAKGMVPWESKLTPIQIQQVSSYILSLDYVSPENGGKEPQGELYTPEESTDEPTEEEAPSEGAE
jgi:cytochrome c oxidase cbb3-type subunit 3